MARERNGAEGNSCRVNSRCVVINVFTKLPWAGRPLPSARPSVTRTILNTLSSSAHMYPLPYIPPQNKHTLPFWPPNTPSTHTYLLPYHLNTNTQHIYISALPPSLPPTSNQMCGAFHIFWLLHRCRTRIEAPSESTTYCFFPLESYEGSKTNLP